MLDVIDARLPRVQLDRADLDQAEEASKIVDPETRAIPALAFFDSEPLDSIRD